MLKVIYKKKTQLMMKNGKIHDTHNGGWDGGKADNFPYFKMIKYINFSRIGPFFKAADFALLRYLPL